MSAQKRDRNYFMKKIAIHENDVHNFVRSKIGEPTATDDITQSTMEKAWEKRDTLQEEEKAKAWLMQIASHAIIDYFRMLRTKRKYEYDNGEVSGRGQAFGEEEWQRMDRIKSEADEAITILMAAEDAKIIVKAFKMLPPMDQKLLTMYYVSELEAKEIARRLSMNYSSVRVYISRAVKKLKILYEQLEGRNPNDKGRGR